MNLTLRLYVNICFLYDSSITMIRIFYCLFIVLCLGSIFVCSRQFTDSYIIPKWYFVLFMSLVVSVYEATRILFSKKIRTAILIQGTIIVVSCFLQAMLGVVQFFGLFQASTAFKVTGSFSILPSKDNE